MFTHRSNSFVRTVACGLVFLFSWVVVIQPAARAKTNFTRQPVEETQYDRQADMEVVNKALQREKVTEKLRNLGYTVDEIKERLDRLGDKEIHQMAQRIEEVKAGGHLGTNELSTGVLIVLIILSPILAVVWLIMMIFGKEFHLHENGHDNS